MCKGLAVCINGKGKILCKGISSHDETKKDLKPDKFDSYLDFELILPDYLKPQLDIGDNTCKELAIKKGLLNSKGLVKKEIMTNLNKWLKTNEMKILKYFITNMELLNYQKVEGDMYCNSQEVEGDMDCNSQKVKGNMSCNSQEVKGDMYCGYQEVKGDMYCNSQKVKGDMYCGYQKVEGDMYCGFQEVKGDMDCGYQKVEGNMDCNSQEVKGNMSCNSQKVEGDMYCNSQEVKSNMYCNSQKVEGNMYCGYQKVKGNMNCNSQKVKGNMNCNSQEVEGNMYCGYQKVKGNMNCNSQEVKSNMYCGYQKVEGDMDCNSQKVKGNMSCNSQEVKSNMYCGYQKVEGDMYCNSQKVEGDMYCGFQEVKGDMDCGYQKVEGNMDCNSQEVKGNIIIYGMQNGNSKSQKLLDEFSKLHEDNYNKNCTLNNFIQWLIMKGVKIMETITVKLVTEKEQADKTPYAVIEDSEGTHFSCWDVDMIKGFKENLGKEVNIDFKQIVKGNKVYRNIKGMTPVEAIIEAIVSPQPPKTQETSEDNHPKESVSSIELTKNSKGYGWKIKVYDEDPRAIPSIIEQINRQLSICYKNTDGIYMDNDPHGELQENFSN